MPAPHYVNVFCLAVLFSGAARAQSPLEYFHVVDRDDDGVLSLPEFQDWMSRAFHKMDSNHDGVLEPQEQLIPNAPRITVAEINQRFEIQFNKQDRNHDGQLSASEYLAPPQ